MNKDIGEESVAGVAQPAWLGVHMSATMTNLQKCNLVEAESYYHKFIETNPDDPLAYNYLGWIRQIQNDLDGEVANYQKALQINPKLEITRGNLAMMLVQLGRSDESFHLLHEILAEHKGLEWIQNLITVSMRARDLIHAGEYAKILAELRWGSPWYPKRRDSSNLLGYVHVVAVDLDDY